MRVISKESIDRENRMDTLDLRHDLDSPGPRSKLLNLYSPREFSGGEIEYQGWGGTTRKGKKRFVETSEKRFSIHVQILCRR